jgi:hypothetical protein
MHLGSVIPLRYKIGLAEIHSLKLPINRGYFNTTQNATIPSFLAGHLKGSFTVMTSENERITCAKVDLHL